MPHDGWPSDVHTLLALNWFPAHGTLLGVLSTLHASVDMSTWMETTLFTRQTAHGALVRLVILLQTHTHTH